MSLTRRAVALGGASAIAVAATPAFARAPEIFMDKGGLFTRAWEFANDGFDVVAYHGLAPGAAPVSGSNEFAAEFKGVTWLFASREHRAAFLENPDRWRPRYGNYCAWAMAREKLAKGDPAVWHIHEGALYLNVSRRIQGDWLAHIERDIARADANWPGLLDLH